jgi:hypothetical protein
VPEEVMNVLNIMFEKEERKLDGGKITTDVPKKSKREGEQDIRKPNVPRTNHICLG